MNKNRITLLSLLVISSVFCISFLFNIRLSLRATSAHTLEDGEFAAAEAKITEEVTEEAITSLFAYSIDSTDDLDNETLKDDISEEQSEDDSREAAGLMSMRAALAATDTEESRDEQEQEQDSYYLDKYQEYDEQRYQDAYNYIAELKAKYAQELAEEEAAKAAKYANIGISIAKEYVNIRKKPSTDSESLGKLYSKSACTIIEVLDGWYYVESGSVTGYAKAEYIQTGIPADELIQKYGTQKVKVTADGLNVRKEPTTEAKRLTVIYTNEKYPVLEQVDDWYKIKIDDENIEGYVKSDFIEIMVTFKEAVSKAEEARLLELKAEERAKKETVIKYRADFSYTADELKLLSCLVHAEAGNQSYEGKLAVANIVLNRVKSSKYPNTIKAVIYQPGQFSVAKSGSLQKQLDIYDNYKSESQKLSIKAAKMALEGANNIGSRLYFHSYKAAVKKGYQNKSNCVKIEDHLFW
jgi:uncharacterized protein YgiM (DUF1202 family)